MEYVVAILALIQSHVLAVILGGYLHYRYGSRVLAMARAAIAAAEAVAKS
jgi:hypothetical protein